MRKLFLGTSNIVLPFPQKNFPPEHSEKSRLQYYATLFNSLEVNSTFYKCPQPATVRRWTDSVGSDFAFTFKLPKVLTHTKLLEFDEDEIPTFFNAINEAAEKKGCLLIQFPPSTGFDLLHKLDHLLAAINFYNVLRWPVAVEFRNESWYEQETFETLRNHDAFVVYHDMMKCPNLFTETTDDTVYFRFHGPEPRYRGSYTNEFLRPFAKKINALIGSARTVYCYFNNTAYTGGAFENLRTLQAMINPDINARYI